MGPAHFRPASASHPHRRPLSARARAHPALGAVYSLPGLGGGPYCRPENAPGSKGAPFDPRTTGSSHPGPQPAHCSGCWGEAGWTQSAQGAGRALCPPPPPSWDVRVDTRSPHPPALGHDASACFIGLAGQERSKTALVGEAVIYPGETKCGKGHTAARAALAAGGEASAVWMRAAVAVDVIFTPSRLAVHGN